MGQGGEILRCQGGRSPVASPWHRHYIRTRGAARRVRSHIPGALSILKGAVPDRARGLGHMAPTYLRREPGIDAPAAIAAPHSYFWLGFYYGWTPLKMPKLGFAARHSRAAMLCRGLYALPRRRPLQRGPFPSRWLPAAVSPALCR